MKIASFGECALNDKCVGHGREYRRHFRNCGKRLSLCWYWKLLQVGVTVTHLCTRRHHPAYERTKRKVKNNSNICAIKIVFLARSPVHSFSTRYKQTNKQWHAHRHKSENWGSHQVQWSIDWRDLKFNWQEINDLQKTRPPPTQPAATKINVKWKK